MTKTDMEKMFDFLLFDPLKKILFDEDNKGST